MLSSNIHCFIKSVATVTLGPIKKARCRSVIATSIFPSNFLFQACSSLNVFNLLTYKLGRWMHGFLVHSVIHLSWSWVARVGNFHFLSVLYPHIKHISLPDSFIVFFLHYLQGLSQILSWNCRILALILMIVFLAWL